MNTVTSSFEKEMAERAAFEAQHNCKIVRTYHKVPPQDFQDLVIKQANTYYAIEGARFIDNVLVATRFGGFNQHTESLSSMLDGLELGYKLALPKLKPYSLTYTQVKFRATFAKLYKGKTESEILDMLNAERSVHSFYIETLPDYMLTRKLVTEHFTTWGEADKRMGELCDWNTVPRIQNSDLTGLKIVHDSTQDRHF